MCNACENTILRVKHLKWIRERENKKNYGKTITEPLRQL